jgi:hypothetical protein
MYVYGLDTTLDTSQDIIVELEEEMRTQKENIIEEFKEEFNTTKRHHK